LGLPSWPQRLEPNLKQAERDIPFVVLGVSNTCSCAHRLHITRVDRPDVSLVITMRDNTFADVADNLNIGVVMETEAGVGRNLIVVQKDEITNRLMGWIAVGSHCDVVFCLQPSGVSFADFIECFEFQHV
jgi:hypothetical protein